MSSPTPSTSGSDHGTTGATPLGESVSALALSGLLKVQRRWALNSKNVDDSLLVNELKPQARKEPPPVSGSLARSRLPVHLEDSEWSRLALGLAEGSLSSIGKSANVGGLQLDPDSVTVYLEKFESPPWPFGPSKLPRAWTLPRDSRMIASVPLTRSIATASRHAALVTFAEAHGRRVLVDLVARSSTLLKGAPAELGTKIAEIAVELGTRRWSDLDTLILVAFEPLLARLDGVCHARNTADALEEVSVRSLAATGSPSICVIVPPWANDPADPLIGELVRFCEQTDGIGILCCASPTEALSRWDLSGPGSEPILSFGDGRLIHGIDLAQVEQPGPKARLKPLTREDPTDTSPRIAPIEVAVLGNVQVNGAPESFRHRRRLTELVAFLAMHPEGTTTDTFATAMWPDRRVPVQTLANRLSETRRALGLASDGRPRLRKQGRRHLIAEAETDWDRFKELAAGARGSKSWRSALSLVRGRPFDGLDRGEWAQLEGFAAAIEASVVEVACRLGDDALSHNDGGLAHWAALQGLLVSPWDERLYRLLMRAADQLGNRGGVDAALRSLGLALELEGDPLLGVHPETSALYRRLTSRSLT